MIIFAEESKWIMDEWCPATEQKPQRWQRRIPEKKTNTPSDHQISFSHFHVENSNCVRPNMRNKQKFNSDKWFNMALKWVCKKVKNKTLLQKLWNGRKRRRNWAERIIIMFVLIRHESEQQRKRPNFILIFWLIFPPTKKVHQMWNSHVK